MSNGRWFRLVSAGSETMKRLRTITTIALVVFALGTAAVMMLIEGMLFDPWFWLAIVPGALILGGIRTWTYCGGADRTTARGDLWRMTISTSVLVLLFLAALAFIGWLIGR
jgi:hypothetical protein